MSVEVAKIEIKSVMDASGLDDRITSEQFNADDVVAVIGKTEGNGGVNDFTRILSDQAFHAVLRKRGTRSDAEIKKIPMVWSGGCDGVITPHATVFARTAKAAPSPIRHLQEGGGANIRATGETEEDRAWFAKEVLLGHSLPILVGKRKRSPNRRGFCRGRPKRQPCGRGCEQNKPYECDRDETSAVSHASSNAAIERGPAQSCGRPAAAPDR
jgi:hypothetical protein